MTATLPAYLPDDDDLAAEEDALAAEDALAGPLTGTTPLPGRRRERVARILADLELDGSLGAPPREAVSARPRAASLLAWAEDPVATLPPLRLPDGLDLGDVTPAGAFALVPLARALVPDLAARGWSVSAGSLVRDGARVSGDDVAEAVVDLVREAVERVNALETVTQPATRGPVLRRGDPMFVPSARFADHLARLAEHAARAHDDDDRLGTSATWARSLLAFYRLNDARALAAHPSHDASPARFTVRLLMTLGDFVTPRARRTVATALRSALPTTPPAEVDGLDAARAWLLTLSGVVERSYLFGAYVTAGAPGGLDRLPILALAADVLGAARKRRGSWVFVVEARP